MALTATQRRTLTRRYQALLEAIAARAVPLVNQQWNALTAYRDEDLEAFTLATAPIADATKRAALTTATGYYATTLAVAPPPILLADVATVFDTLAPFIVTRKALGNGASLQEAAVMGRSTAQASTRDLTISTARTTGDVFADRAGVQITAWERNANTGACPWCVERDGGVYDTAEAGDFGHDRCGCTVSPLA